MATWIILAVIAQFLYAVVAVIDRYIVTSATVPRPIAYAFYVTALSALAGLVFLFSWIPVPFADISIPSFANVGVPTSATIALSLMSGVTFFFALVFLFSALKRSPASDVIPVVGAFSALAAFLLSYLFLGTQLTRGFFWGFLILVAGTFVLSHFRFGSKTLLLSIGSGLMFGAHFVLLKYLFTETNFDNAFFWSRMGITATAFMALLFPLVRSRLRIRSRKKRRKAGVLVLGNKLIAGLASIMLLKATELGDVSIVQALGGFQFAFLLSFTVLLGRSLPQACGEHSPWEELVHKIIAVSVIIIGFAVLFL